MKTLLSHARVVLPNEILEDASVLLEDDCILAVCPENQRVDCEINLKHQYLMPGLVDLHCDALEKEVEPRPNVHFPLDFACAQADKRNAAAGVTTVYHALSFAKEELGVRNNEVAAELARAVHQWQPHGLVDNRVHCRYEITDATALPILLQLLVEQSMHIVSMMDHTPGQGQFKNLNAYREFITRTYEKTDAEVDALVEQKMADAAGAYQRMQNLAQAAHEHGIAVASHDDDSPQRVATMSSLGADISEFPITLDAARAAKQAGMATIFGAPNVLRGKSQSGSMKAVDAIIHGVADCLCADYAPATLIVAVFKISQHSELTLPQALQLASSNPARAAKLSDRGEIAAGKRADLITIAEPGGLPQVTDTWVAGQRVYSVAYDRA